MLTTVTAQLYNSLRAMGMVTAAEIPSRITRQAMELGVHQGNESACRTTLAALSRVASQASMAEFEVAFRNGSLSAGKASKGEALLAGAVDSCEGGCAATQT
ncbi:hypothetical protein [Hyalangium versicolor]|uniref:hypothetical protein n=1 Tax=Hyalangium versicolor TaxID=2861190 RepID=UPI001CCACD7A|nr:hypothetical protein [Hyalangium versicolor]